MEWLIEERRLDLLPVGTFIRDSHHRKFPTQSKQDLNPHWTIVHRFCWIRLWSSDTNYTMAPLSPVEYLILESLTLYWNLIKPQQNIIFSFNLATKYLNDRLKATLKQKTNAQTFLKQNFLHFNRFLQKNLKWPFAKGNQMPQNYWNYRSVKKISRETGFEATLRSKTI